MISHYFLCNLPSPMMQKFGLWLWMHFLSFKKILFWKQKKGSEKCTWRLQNSLTLAPMLLSCGRKFKNVLVNAHGFITSGREKVSSDKLSTRFRSDDFSRRYFLCCHTFSRKRIENFPTYSLQLSENWH